MAQPDANGNLIPNYIQEGSVVFSNPKGRAQWMTVAVCGALYNPRKATCEEICTECDGYSAFAVVENPYTVAVNGTVQLHAQATYPDGTVDDFTTSSTWSSSNTAVATVGASTGLVTGVSGGSAEITALMPSVVAYNGDLCGQNGEPLPCPQASPDPEASGTVADATPVINSINPDYWLVGATTTGVIISGQHFGTSPIVNFSDPAVTCTQTGASDTLITCNITVGANASGGMVNVTVTSQGYNGSGFMPMPNGGSQATSSSYPADEYYQPTYAVLTATGSYSSPYCPSNCGKYRTYSAYDSTYHLLPMSMTWTLHENVTSSSSCNMVTGGTETEPTFTDYIANCDAGCTFTSTQWFSAVYQGYTYTLKAQDCVDPTFKTCKVHTGWSVTATTSSVTVTDN